MYKFFFFELCSLFKIKLLKVSTITLLSPILYTYTKLLKYSLLSLYVDI